MKRIKIEDVVVHRIDEHTGIVEHNGNMICIDEECYGVAVRHDLQDGILSTASEQCSLKEFMGGCYELNSRIERNMKSVLKYLNTPAKKATV